MEYEKEFLGTMFLHMKLYFKKIISGKQHLFSNLGRNVGDQMINTLLLEVRSPFPSTHYQELNSTTSDMSDLSIRIFLNGTE